MGFMSENDRVWGVDGKKSCEIISANELTPLIIHLQYASSAGIAQLVEHDLAKVGVASSSLVSRSRYQKPSAKRQGVFLFRMFTHPL